MEVVVPEALEAFDAAVRLDTAEADALEVRKACGPHP